METNYHPDDVLHNDVPRETPSGLKTLTTLTYIGCAFAYISTIWGFFGTKNSQKNMEQLQEARDKMGDGFMGRWIDASMEMVKKGEQFQTINIVLTLIFTTMCLVGAMRMRQLRKSGFPIYAFGELAPIPVLFALFGVNLVTGITGGFTALIAILFTLLYARQRQHLVRN
ncbi:hypothetical protein EPD60_03845 [Flaviaesturariibacter flavus]|uniref:Uncharacterized protein n=1 Tax=Flaviaesturariibacter flavus TaxID=2502780 RepID=A0A4R1BMD4_9BACT|nr:hypothetical protein [Flaviaesturariibacter flavus]TCJ18641.1 hypothetical protein EPD60_03845 [Flaviaesturariibacter flavus]